MSRTPRRQATEHQGGIALRAALAWMTLAPLAGGLCLIDARAASAQEPEPEPAAYAEEKYPDRLDGTLSA